MTLPLLLFTLTCSIVAVRISPKNHLGEREAELRSGSSLVQVENADEAAKPIPEQSELLATYSGLRFEKLVAGDDSSVAWKEYPDTPGEEYPDTPGARYSEVLNRDIAAAYTKYQAECAVASMRGEKIKIKTVALARTSAGMSFTMDGKFAKELAQKQVGAHVRTFVFGVLDPWGTIEPTGIKEFTEDTGRKASEETFWKQYSAVRVIPFNGVGLAIAGTSGEVETTPLLISHMGSQSSETSLNVLMDIKTPIPDQSETQSWTSNEQASRELSVVYKDILMEFIESGEGQLWLPPVSHYRKTDNAVIAIDIVTREALKQAVLSIPRARSLCGKPIQLNILKATDFKVFRDAMKGFRAELNNIMQCGYQESLVRTPLYSPGARCCMQTGKPKSLALWMSDRQQITKQSKERNKGNSCIFFCKSMVCPSHWERVDQKHCNQDKGLKK